MSDTDFPVRLSNSMASNPAGYLQMYVQGMREYEQAGTGIRDFRVQKEYAQEEGGPLMQSYEVSGNPSFEIEKPGYGPQVPDHLMMPVLERRYPGTLDRIQRLKDKLPDLGIYKRV